VIDRLRYQVQDLARDLVAHLRRKDEEVNPTADSAEEELEQVLADLDVLLLQAKREH
jgi:hypothetical protein